MCCVKVLQGLKLHPDCHFVKRGMFKFGKLVCHGTHNLISKPRLLPVPAVFYIIARDFATATPSLINANRPIFDDPLSFGLRK